ncbi:TfoX/Sxy family protein [Rivibacter subsaxonicus]|uniref:DNA transformation protein n=1 Tax=Rivibacter subsaxonicus TaxID=457575 RepID=A0A4Q7VZI0_9BURK|nr:TfoX/Sxy family protein [Rivibacter subsaxonicus]RZU02180.1 DNA transformation protein [Rivibacter subsaxonicus]
MATPPRAPPPYVSLCLELLSPLGRVTARAMFGGYGLYVDGLMVGLVAGEQLYLKTDAQSIEAWRAAGCHPFSYERGGGKPPIEMSYWTPPVEAFDGEHAMQPWARLALAAALRKRAAKPTGARPRRG